MQEGPGTRGREILRSTEEINRAISERLKEGKTLRISGLRGQDRIAAHMDKTGRLILEGELGDYAVALNRRLLVTVKGSAGRFLCWRMRGGEVVIEGEVGDEAALGVEEGRILIRGDVKGSVASYLKGGVVVVNGNVKGEVAAGGGGGLVVVMGEVKGEVAPSGTRVLLEPSRVPLLKRKEMKKLTPQELKEVRELLGEWAPGDLENYLLLRAKPVQEVITERRMPSSGGPFRHPTNLRRILLTMDPFSQTGPSAPIYLKSRIGEGSPVVLPEPFFIPHHLLTPLNEATRQAVVAFSLKSGIPLFIGREAMGKEFMDALKSITYFTVMRPPDPFPQGEILDSASGVVFDLTSRVGGVSLPFRELKDPRDMLKLIQLFREEMGLRVVVFYPSGAAFRLTGLVALSGADGAVLLTSSAPYGTAGGFGNPPHTTGDIESLSGAHLALEELEGRGKGTSLMLDGGVAEGEEVVKALSMGARAVSLAPFILKWLGCRGCEVCEPQSCPASILEGSGDPPWAWDEMAERLIDEYGKLREDVEDCIRRMGLKGVQELSRKNLLALDWESAYVTSLPLAGLERRVQD